MRGYNTDIAMIRMIDDISKKHGIDQVTVYHDIKILKILMQRYQLSDRS